MLSSKVDLVASDRPGVLPTLVARTRIEADQPVWWRDDAVDPPARVFRRKELLDLPEPAREGLIRCSRMVEDDLIASGDPAVDRSLLFRHSCDPNCGFDADDRVVTLCPIEAGTELAWDRAMTETEASLHAGRACHCRSAHCRGTLRFDRWRSRAFQTRFADRLSSFIAAKGLELSWYDPRIYPETRADGTRTLTALAPIPRGAVAMVLVGKVVTLDHVLELPDHQAPYILQVSERLWQVPRLDSRRTEATDQILHSCDASGGMLDSTTVVTRRDLEAGDEINIDYGTVNTGAVGSHLSDNFACACGAAACRAQVTSQDWRLPSVQERYWPLFPPHVRALITPP